MMETEKNIGEFTITLKLDIEEFEKEIEKARKLLRELLELRERTVRQLAGMTSRELMEEALCRISQEGL